MNEGYRDKSEKAWINAAEMAAVGHTMVTV